VQATFLIYPVETSFFSEWDIDVTYSFFLFPFFLKFLGFLPAVIGSQVILQGEEYLLKNNNNFIHMPN
jgi:hypothetical protein